MTESKAHQLTDYLMVFLLQLMAIVPVIEKNDMMNDIIMAVQGIVIVALVFAFVKCKEKKLLLSYENKSTWVYAVIAAITGIVVAASMELYKDLIFWVLVLVTDIILYFTIPGPTNNKGL